MEYAYFVNQGIFREDADKLIFCGQTVAQSRPFPNEQQLVPSYGEVLFPIDLKAGMLSYEISFEGVESGTRAGIILNYRNQNGMATFYQIGIRRQASAYGLDYYDGQKWNFIVFGGSPNSIEEKKKYSISAKLRGNILTLYINTIPVLECDKFANGFMGVCGIYVCNSTDATIQNIHIEQELPSVFCIMKFEKDFNALYKDVIKPQCKSLGLTANRADEHYTSNSILQDIIQDISNASIIIADVTMDNPNVFYELGFAHALKKPTVLLADIEKREKLPFDISGYRTIFYSNTIGGKSEIEETLIRYLKTILGKTPY